jgi:hypothetical protein
MAGDKQVTTTKEEISGKRKDPVFAHQRPIFNFIPRGELFLIGVNFVLYGLNSSHRGEVIP